MVLVLIALAAGAYWAGPMKRDDGWSEPVYLRWADRKSHAARIDPGMR